MTSTLEVDWLAGGDSDERNNGEVLHLLASMFGEEYDVTFWLSFNKVLQLDWL